MGQWKEKIQGPRKKLGGETERRDINSGNGILRDKKRRAVERRKGNKET